MSAFESGVNADFGIDVAIAGAAALAVVALHVHREPAVLAGREVEQLQRLPRVVARRVDEPLAVRARDRTERAFVLVRADEQLAVLAIELRDLVRPDDARASCAADVRVVVGCGFVVDQARVNPARTVPRTFTHRDCGSLPNAGPRIAGAAGRRRRRAGAGPLETPVICRPEPPVSW